MKVFALQGGLRRARREWEDIQFPWSRVSSFGNPYSLALTGGIACGKSTVGAMLQEKGLRRVDSDQVARQVVMPGSVGLDAVVARFGREVLLADGSMDRKAIGRIVFADPQARRDLERIVHPLIWVNLEDAMTEAAQRHLETVFEIPLLFENGNENRFSTVWVVSSSPQVQLQRLRQRDGLSAEEARARIDSQMSVEEKARRATFVIINDGDPKALEARIDQGLHQWRRVREAGRV